jgi:protein-tyrosine-phosphatase
VVARIRDIVDSLLHPLRRRRARELVRGANPRSVLFVCTGNICRSPFAAALFANRIPQRLRRAIKTSSAGFIGPGRPSPEHALATARGYQVDLADHRSAVLTNDVLDAADLIVVMSEEQRRGLSARVGRTPLIVVLGDLDPLPITRRTILDPWDGPPEAFADSYARIERTVGELVDALWAPV